MNYSIKREDSNFLLLKLFLILSPICNRFIWEANVQITLQANKELLVIHTGGSLADTSLFFLAHNKWYIVQILSIIRVTTKLRIWHAKRSLLFSLETSSSLVWCLYFQVPFQTYIPRGYKDYYSKCRMYQAFERRTIDTISE